MLNVTDDGWFGRTAGPYQHFAQARLRTIEQGLPLLRAANTGISAIVDAYGRVLAQLPLGETGVVDGILPGKIAPPPFARAPSLAGLLAWVVALLRLSRAETVRLTSIENKVLLQEIALKGGVKR